MSNLRTEVERTLASSRHCGDDLIWGPAPRDEFVFGGLKAEDPRAGDAMDWVLRAMVAFYFVEHDNQPASTDEVYSWVADMTPGQVEQAVSVCVVIGLP